MKLLQDTNRYEEAARQNAEELNRKYHSLYQEYMALKPSDYCKACQLKKDTTPKVDMFTLCAECGKGKQAIASLKLELEKKKNKDNIGKTVTREPRVKGIKVFLTPNLSEVLMNVIVSRIVIKTK